jgi:hypothetical protein
VRVRISIVFVLLFLMAPRPSLASGHGPVFGSATPTLGKGAWQIDQAWLVRLGDGPGTEEQTLRTMVSFGVTEDVQISASVPIMLETSYFMPRGRLTAMMSPSREVEAIAAWRVHKRAIGSARAETTLLVGGAFPMGTYAKDGMRTAPSLHISGSTGYASRAHYLWVGGGYHHHAERQGDQMGDVAFYSVVYGYRPPVLRLDYPKPDLRFFVEAVGEHTQRAQHHGFEYLPSGGRAVLVGPTALLLYKAYGLEGGILFPVYQVVNYTPPERFRAAINLTYFFWLK